MPFLDVHVARLQLAMTSTAMAHDADVPTSVRTDASLVPSHHGCSMVSPGSNSDDDDHNDDDGWLTSEPSPGFLGDWLRGDIDTQVPLPRSTPLTLVWPPSPTSVESTSTAGTSLLEASPATMHKHFDPCHRPAGCGSETVRRGDANVAKLKEQATGVPRNHLRAPAAFSVKREDGVINVHQSPEDSVNHGLRLEIKRRKQRAYEKKYRKKRQIVYRALCDEWAATEIELYLLMRDHAKPFRVDQPHASLEQLRKEAHAALIDNFVLKGLDAWRQIVDFRNYTDSEVLRTRDAWAKMDRALLGACTIKPFQPFRQQFQW